MIYLGFENINDQKARVYLRHYNPETLPKELLGNGVVVDDIPAPEEIEGKSPELYVNPQTKEMWYEYIDIPKTPDDMNEERIAHLEAALIETTALLAEEQTKRNQTDQAVLELTTLLVGGNA